MVMEGAPSPQCVGREFVRQYYTLLNKAPEYLHRFYSHNSSFTHGGKEKSGDEDQAVVIGQTEIHKKIMSLNFRDCHAKIRYVDSQVTVETGVVVQVTGELSTAGQPLRRFMQTFVLAPQSANKYYVHNDIFRYQDEVFSDSDDEEDFAEPSVQPGVHQSADKMELNNGGDHAHDSYFVKAGGISEQSVSQAPQAEQISEPVITNGHERPSDAPLKDAGAEKLASGDMRPASQAPADEPSVALSHEEPRSFSWAGLITRTGGTAALPAGMAGTTAPVANVTESSVTEQPDTVPAQLPAAGGNRGDNSTGGRLSSDSHTGSGGMEERRPDRVRYTDGQQVFVGNLPPTISELELKGVFKAYGNVIEVRISRANHKPSFGFVVFEEEASAQQVLQNKKNIEYEGQRLNVEEKRKPEARVHSASRMGGRGGGGPRHMRGGGGRGGGYGGPPRDDSGNRSGQGRFGGGNRPNHYQPRQ